MNARLAKFLYKNRARIVEAWEAEIEMPAPHADMTHGDVSYDFLEGLFDQIVGFLQYKNSPEADRIPFYSFMDFTFTCTPGNSACIELHRAGKKAFADALKSVGGSSKGINQNEIEVFKRYIDNTLAVLVRAEIEQCASICPKPFCPFTASSRSDKHATAYHFLGRSRKIFEPLSTGVPC